MAAVKGKKSIPFPNFFIFLHIISCHSKIGTDTLPQGQPLKDGEYLVSAGNVFTLGFFTPSSTKRKPVGYFGPELLHNRYLGIWYKDTGDKRPVWVANRDNLIRGRSGSLVIDKDGLLKVLEDGKILIPLSSNRTSKETGIILKDNGNLVLSELNSDGSRGWTLWQSFDHPTDTLLFEMKLGFGLEHNWSITSWLSDEVPATGSFTLGADPNGTDQLVIWKRGNVYWKSGKWNDGKFENLEDYVYKFNFSNKYERFFTLYGRDLRITSPLFMINELGMLRISNPEFPITSSFNMTSLVDCHEPFDFFSKVYSYPERFVSRGCVGAKLPECHDKLRFGSKTGYLGTTGVLYRINNMSIADCEALCLRKCSCVAYATYYHNDTACQLWSNRAQLNSLKFDNEGDKEVYILLDHSHDLKGLSIWRSLWLRTTTIVISLLIVSLVCICYFKWRKLTANIILNPLFYSLRRKVRARGKRLREEDTSFIELGSTASHSARFRRKRRLKILYYKSHGLQLFSFDVLSQATDGFSPSNKLGQGGFGTVYKGNLHDGQEIAVKRLSRSSKQGLMEFKNELKVLAKLQHTNLVKIVGCCVERGEKLIIYEYMPNKSLDWFLSDPDRKVYLDWNRRFNIIEGIAQGMLYLHKYSRLKIIHRDLKAANILLNDEFNAKISDFGMARIFGRDESHASTSKIAGTLGYMPPEYVMLGKYSEKSDIFSFGVLLIEIVSGKKNNASYHEDRPLNLIGHAWELWMENRGLELIDEALDDDFYAKKQAIRCIHVGLLCAQEQPTDRPSMSDVVAMISNESIQLGPPNRPAFFFISSDLMINMNPGCEVTDEGSLNEASITEMLIR